MTIAFWRPPSITPIDQGAYEQKLKSKDDPAHSTADYALILSLTSYIFKYRQGVRDGGAMQVDKTAAPRVLNILL